MHSRDLKYVNSLFRAYATEEKILETLTAGRGVRHQHGLRDRRQLRRAVQPRATTGTCSSSRTSRSRRARPSRRWPTTSSSRSIPAAWRCTSGACRPTTLVRDGEVGELARAVEMAKKHGLPVGVGGHSLQVPMQCEKNGVPCDFYVKTLHSDDYPSATPKELRKEFIWLDGGEGWYDNMWCINPEETIAFMKTVDEALDRLQGAGRRGHPAAQAFPYAFKNGADFIAVGMFDFQIKANCELAERAIRHAPEAEDRSQQIRTGIRYGVFLGHDIRLGFQGSHRKEAPMRGRKTALRVVLTPEERDQLEASSLHDDLAGLGPAVSRDPRGRRWIPLVEVARLVGMTEKHVRKWTSGS